MVYALAAIGLVIGLFIWSMCRIAGRYDENFEPLDQHDRHTDQRDLGDLHRNSLTESEIAPGTHAISLRCKASSGMEFTHALESRRFQAYSLSRHERCHKDLVAN